MVSYTVMGVVLVLIVAGALIFLDWLTFKVRGDCQLVLNASAIQEALKWRQDNQLRLRFTLPLENHSLKEQALLIFAYVQLVPHSREEKHADAYARLTLNDSPRQDGYFEAVLVKPGKSIGLRFDVLFQGESTLTQVLSRDVLRLDLCCRYYGRTPMVENHFPIEISLAAFQDNPSAFSEIATAKPETPPNLQNKKAIPIKMPIIFPGTDLPQLIRTYAGNQLEAGDFIALAESMVAIVQRRVFPVTDIEPGFWAKRLNRSFHFNSSLASCYSMEMAIREVGLPRILLATMVGLLGRAVGRTGDFYRIAGRGVASIDDSTGTLPPFDKSVVMGPGNPNKTAETLRQATGHEIAIVDANDLGKVDILGKSSGIVDEIVVDALRKNPQGNSDEQTPIVLIKHPRVRS